MKVRTRCQFQKEGTLQQGATKVVPTGKLKPNLPVCVPSAVSRDCPTEFVSTAVITMAARLQSLLKTKLG